jgi:DNA-binding XRE family transcriptional regulator
MSKTTVNQRFAKMIEELGLNPNQFAKALGIATAQIYNINNGRNAPSFDLLSKIALKYPNVNMVWLLTGNGPIITTDAGTSNEGLGLVSKIKTLENKIAELDAQMKKGSVKAAKEEEEDEEDALILRISEAVAKTMRSTKKS